MPQTAILSRCGESAIRMVATLPSRRRKLKNALIACMPQRIEAGTVVMKRDQAKTLGRKKWNKAIPEDATPAVRSKDFTIVVRGIIVSPRRRGLPIWRARPPIVHARSHREFVCYRIGPRQLLRVASCLRGECGETKPTSETLNSKKR